MQRSGTIWAILVGCHPTIIPEVLSKSAKQLGRRCHLKVFSIFSPGDHLVQRSVTIWAILVEGHPMIIPVKFHQNLPSSYRGDVV